MQAKQTLKHATCSGDLLGANSDLLHYQQGADKMTQDRAKIATAVRNRVDTATVVHNRTLHMLSEFDISPERGFLPDPDPIVVLPHSEVFSPLEDMAGQLPKLLVAGALRKELMDFSKQILCQVAQHASGMVGQYARDSQIARRLKVIFDYLGQAYVWGQDPPATSIPEGFAEFWFRVSDKLDLPPVLCYAPYALYNWRRLDPDKPIALGNIAIVQNFLGGMDEDWFVLIHVDIEHQARPIPGAIITALQATASADADALLGSIATITASLENMLETLNRMPEFCDPYIYYTRVRPYLHGWKDNPSLPNGLHYPAIGQYKFRGESGAQSAIVPSLVAALDIRHTESTFTPYLAEMLNYMPKEHRRFVRAIEHLAHNGHSILDFVVARKDTNPELYASYRDCRHTLHAFRQKHFEYAGRYIHAQDQRHGANPHAIGTAGTPFMTSLKQLMDETWFD